MNRIGKLTALMLGLWAGAAVAATASSNVFKLDFRTGDRVSAGTEELTFSNLWDGDADATVTIAQDGAAIFTGLTGEGAKPWTVDRNGRYVLTHTTYTNGVAGKVETAVFVVEGKEVPVRELTVEWEAGSYMYDNTGKTPGVMAKNGDQVLEKGVDYTVHYEGNTNAGTAKAILTGLPPYVGSVTNEFAIAKRVVELTSGSASKPYDGTPLVCHSVTTNGDGFVTGEGVDLAFTGSQTIAGSSKNTFDYTFKTGTLEGNYTITKAEGDLEVTSGEIVNPFDPDDPSKPVTPEVLAKANCITNYDGEGHAIDIASLLNPLVADCLMAIEYALDPANEPFAAENPTFTNVVTTSVWYRITSSNFKPFTTNAVLTISPRSIANVAVAAIADQTYSGSGIEPMPVVTDMRTLAGNSDPTDILTSADYDLSYLNNTNVGTAKVVLLGKSNYEGALTNTFQIVPAIIPPGPSGAIAATGYTNAYDGAAHGVSVSVAGLKTQPTVQYKSSPSAEWQDESPTYADVCDTQVWWKVSAPNYQSVEGMIGLKIAQAENAWTIEPAIEGWTYGTAAKTPVGAAKFGEVAFTYSPATVGPAGDYTLTASVSGTANYTGLSKTVGFTITKATLPPDVTPDPVTPDPANPGGPYSTFDYVGVYDGAGHTIDTNGLSAAFKGVVGDGFAVSYAVGESGGLGQLATPWSAVAPVFTNAATNVVWYKVSSANYADIVHAAKVAIVPRAIAVASVGGTWTYDTVAHGTNEVKVALSTSGQETASPFPEGEGIEVDTSSFPTITDVGEKDNTFEWAFAEGTLAGNYAVTVRYGKLKVEPRTIGDDPANWDIRLDKAPTYNGEVQSAPIIQVCYVKPDGNLDYIPYTLAGNTATDAGNYKVRISGAGNYTGTVEKDWAIMPRNVTLKSGTAVWEYDGATHVTNVVEVTGDGFVDGEGATYSDFPQVKHVADAATPLENAFTYTLNENTKAQNYVINVVKGTVTMTKRPITLTAPTKSKTYDGTALTFGAEEIGETYAGATGGAAGVRALPAGESFVYSNFASITEAGQVAAMFMIADGTALMTDYEITVTPGATLTVTKNATEITVTAKNGEWTYDGAAHSLHEYEAANLGTLLTGDMLEVTFDETSVVTTPVDGEGHNGQVPNTITGVRVIRRGAEDVSANYTLAWYPGSLTVKKRPVTLKSKDASKTYDGTALTKHEVEVGGDGFVGDDGASYEFTGMQTDKGKSKNAFTYTLNEGTNAAYYDITPTEGELEVFAADIGEAEDGDWQVVLGPALTYTGIAQVQTLASVTLEGLVVDYSIDGNQQTDAGEYEMTLIGQGNFTGKKKVAWSIAPKALTLTAGSGTKVYDGAALTVGTVTADGFVANETATFVCTGSQLDVGSSENAVGTITWTAAKASNYSVTKNPGTLAVTARPVVVKSKNISKPYDGTPLTLTAADISESYTGGAAGVRALPEGESFVYSGFASRTEAGQTSATFSIAAGANTKLSNYAITPAYGTITVTKSATEIGVTPASETWTYDGEVHSNRTWTATNLDTLQAGDELVVTFDDSSVVTTPRDGVAQDGAVENAITSVRVIRGGVEDVTANYTVTPYPGVLKVVKRPVTVTVVGHVATNVYDSVEHAVSGYEISTSDELYDIAADTSFTGADTVSRTDVGSADMGLSASDFENGNENFTVTYAVTDGRLVIEAADITVGDGADFVLSLGANPKYNGTVQMVPVTAVTYKGLPVTYTLAGEVATHAGTYTLTVKANGNFTGERSTTWQVLKRQVVLTSVGAFKIYDGTPLRNDTVNVSGDGFIGAEGAAYAVTGAQTAVGTSKNAFTYTLNAGTLAGDYDISTVFGDLVVARASLPSTDDPDPIDPGVDPEDPEQREDPDVRFSAFDYVGVYDGDEHTIDTNALKAAYETAFGESVTIGYMDDASGAAGVCALPPIVVDAAVTSFWYKVSSANYNDVVKPCKIAITNRAVTLTSASQEWTYDGAAHSSEAITIGGMGFVAGEGVTTNGFATIKDVGTAPNAFAYAFASGTKAENYVVTCVTGTLSVVKAALPPVDDPDPVDPSVDPEDHEQREDPNVRFSAFDYVGVYDGDEHTIDTNALQAAYETVFGESVTIGYMDDASGAAGVRALPPIVRDAAVTSFWYKVSSANYNDVVKPCKIAITNRAVTLTSASREWTYDGAAHSAEAITIGGMGFVAGEGVTTNGFATITNVGTAPNAFAYAFASGTKAENYVVTCVTGTLSVVKASLPPVDDPDPIDPGVDPEDPEQREDPDVRFSAFDYVGVYDGEAHTIDTNALKAAYETAFGESVTIGYMDDASGAAGVRALPPIVRDAAVTSFWYKVSSANYNDVVKPCKVAITNRAVTLTSASREWTYDGAAHSAEEITIGGDGFVAGEGVITNDFATITNVGTAPNAFSYAFASGTKAENYVVTCVTGTLSVVKAALPPVDDPDPIDPGVDPEDPEQREDPDVRFSAFDYVGVYDGDEHTIDTNALKAAYETAFGESVTIGYMDDASGAAGVRALPPIVRDAAVTSFWYKVSAANFDDIVHPCKVAITNRAVTLTSASQEWTYDGAAHSAEAITIGGDGFVAGEGVTTNGFATITNVGIVPNAFSYAFVSGTKSENYVVTCVTGTLSVVKAALPPGEDPDPIDPGVDPEDPEQREDPDIRFSAFDYVGVYDGEAHTIDTNALKAAYETAFGESVTIGYMDDASGAAGVRALPPIVRDAAVTSFWYKVSAANFDDIVHSCKVAITNRAVTVTIVGHAATNVYDAVEHIVSGYEATTADELYDIAAGTTFDGTAEVKRTDVGKSEMELKPEDFTNTDDNFVVTYLVTDGCVEIELADITVGAEKDFVLTLGANPKYDGTEQTIPVTTVTYNGIPVTCDLAGENATHAGTYTLTVKAKGNFSGERSVTWQVLKRQVTLTSGSATRAYNGQPLVNGNVTVSGDGFIGVEGATFETSGSQTEAGSSKNTFTYTLKAGTLAGDYEITKVEGDLTVTKATFDPHTVFPELEAATEEDGILCERVFNGKPQPFEIEVSESFTEAYEILYAVTPGVWSSVAPTLTDVSDGDLKVFFRFVSPNFEPYEGFGTLRIVQKELTDEMVQPGEDAFFFDGADKKPTVDVVYEVEGKDICTENDYTLEYGEKAGTGWWVTVTGKGNYSGTVTKIVPVLKRPVAPPVVPSKAYNGKNQKPTIPTDERWTVVANPGGTDAGEYTNVVLRLTDTANYKWKGGTEEDTDVTLVFKVTKANNGWSRNPDMRGWEYGQTPSEPNMGQARYGTVQVAYRKAGTDVSTETSVRPELPGKYIARFWADETENYIGVAVNTHKEIEFEITGTGPAADHTLTTPEPVPYKWLEPYLAQFAGGKTGVAGYEAAGNATGANGVALWESYVAGLDPTDALSRFTAKIKMSADNKPIVSWQPALNGETSEGAGILKGERVYRIHGKVNLDDATWTPDIDPKGGVYRFYKITVELPKE